MTAVYNKQFEDITLGLVMCDTLLKLFDIY